MVPGSYLTHTPLAASFISFPLGSIEISVTSPTRIRFELHSKEIQSVIVFFCFGQRFLKKAVFIFPRSIRPPPELSKLQMAPSVRSVATSNHASEARADEENSARSSADAGFVTMSSKKALLGEPKIYYQQRPNPGSEIAGSGVRHDAVATADAGAGDRETAAPQCQGRDRRAAGRHSGQLAGIAVETGGRA